MNQSTIKRVLTALAIGLLGTFVVALFGALCEFNFSPPFTLGEVEIPNDASEPAHNAAPFQPELMMHSENMFVSLDTLLDDQDTALILLTAKRVGFPFRCFEGRLWVVSFDSASQFDQFAEGGFVPARDVDRFVPIRPRLAGLLANTFVYGAPVFIAMTLLAHRRRAERIRNHKCVGCGQIVIRGSARCQECGRLRTAPKRPSG